MGKLGWIIAIILIILALISGIFLGISVFKGDFVGELATISYPVDRADLCTNNVPFSINEDQLGECHANIHLFGGGYKCTCLLL